MEQDPIKEIQLIHMDIINRLLKIVEKQVDYLEALEKIKDMRVESHKDAFVMQDIANSVL